MWGGRPPRPSLSMTGECGSLRRDKQCQWLQLSQRTKGKAANSEAKEKLHPLTPKQTGKDPRTSVACPCPLPQPPPTPVQSARPSSPGETKFPQSPAWSSTRRQTQGTHGRWKTLSRSQRTQTEQQGMGAASFRKAANKRSREGGNQSESFMDDDRVSPSSRKQRQEVAGP